MSVYFGQPSNSLIGDTDFAQKSTWSTKFYMLDVEVASGDNSILLIGLNDKNS